MHKTNDKTFIMTTTTTTTTTTTITTKKLSKETLNTAFNNTFGFTMINTPDVRKAVANKAHDILKELQRKRDNKI